MNILIIYQYHIRPGDAGITRYSQFARHWTAKGHKVKIIAGMVNYFSGQKPAEYKGSLWVVENENSGAEVLRVFTSSIGYRTFWGRLLSYLTFSVSALLGGILSEKPDIVISASPPIFVGLIGQAVAFLKRARFVFEIRDLWPDEAIELGIINNKILIKFGHALEKFLYAKAAMIMAVTPAFKTFLTSEKSVATEKIAVVPNSADLTALSPQDKNNFIREKLNWQNKFIVLYIGAHSLVYNFQPILDTAKILKQAKPDILFVLIGDGRQKPSLTKYAKTNGLTNVQFYNPVSKKEIGGYINAADVCVATLKNMKYLRHVYAAKLFDYMACAKPIILGMKGASADLVCRDAKAGVEIEPENAQEFENAVLQFYNNPNERETLGKNGYEFVKNNFSDVILAAKYEESLKKIL